MADRVLQMQGPHLELDEHVGVFCELAGTRQV